MFRPLLVTLTACAAFAASNAWADRGPPAPKSAEVTAPLVINKGGRRHHIAIPAKYLVNAQAQAPAPDAPQQAAIPTRTLLAGSAIALAVAAGLVLARRERIARLAAALLVAASVCGLGGTAIADLRVDPPKKREAPQAEQVVIEFTDQGNDVIFVTR